MNRYQTPAWIWIACVALAAFAGMQLQTARAEGAPDRATMAAERSAAALQEIARQLERCSCK